MVQRRRACSRRKAGRSAPVLGRAVRLGPVEDARPARSGCRRRRPRRRRRHRPSACSSTSLGRDESDGRRRRRLRRCIAPGKAVCRAVRRRARSSARRARGAGAGGGSGRWSRRPGAPRIAAKRSEPGPPPIKALRGPAGSQSSLPDDLPSLAEKPNERPFTNGGWWGNAAAPTSSALLRFTQFVPTPTRRIKAISPTLLTALRIRHVARLHHRPSVLPTDTGTPKHADTCSEVTTSRSRARRHQCATAHEATVGEPGRDLLAVVGDEDDRRRVTGRPPGAASCAEQPLPRRPGPGRRTARRGGPARARS